MTTEVTHRGEFLKQKIKSSNYNYKDIIEGLEIGRTTLYNYLKNPELPIEKMLEITNFMRIDVSDVFEMAKNISDIKKVEDAIKDLEEIITNHGDDLFGDDANYLAATLYEETLHEKEKAQQYYMNHLLKYPGSIYVTEARKRARRLRGDRQ